MRRVATRYHDFSYGHRVHGHENKCAQLHGHNGRAHFTVAGELDAVGRVLDFSAIKMFSNWLEDHWDHKFLAWENDPLMRDIEAQSPSSMLHASLIWVPFNPTAENMAEYLLTTIGPELLAGTNVTLVSVRLEETRKCSAEVSLP